jgi:asparagine synthase (glutamine-hydrolysing)
LFAGSFTSLNSYNYLPYLRNVFDTAENEDLSLSYVSAKGFEGCFCLNRRLPYSPGDFYFADSANDIIVLSRATFYNKPELIAFLDLKEAVPVPELIASLFIKEGPSFAERVNGDFAIFICRPGKKEVFLIRDHVGIAPMAYVTEKETIYFSSDIIGLSAVFSEGEALDSEYLLGCFKYIDYRRTPVGKVKKLLPGHYLHFSADGTTLCSYWNPAKIKIDNKLHYASVLSDLNSLVCDAVKIRCDKRFTAGAHVSGGLDSGIVSVLARKEYGDQKEFYGFSWSPLEYNPGNALYDERDMVNDTCSYSGITPVFSDMTPDEYLRYVDNFYINQGYFPEEKVTVQAAERKVNMLFSGWGGDEFISTGDRGIEIDLLRRIRLFKFFRRNPLRHPRQFIRWISFYIINPFLGILNSATVRSFNDDAFYIKKEFRRSDRKAVSDYYFHHSRRQMHLRLLHLYNLQERCESWSVAGYRKGIEYRYPLLDKRIIEYMLKVPSTVLCEKEGFRPLLRDIGIGLLPESVRLQMLKSEPVCWGNVAQMENILSGILVKEVKDWSLNKDLSFVDFDLLTDDIRLHSEQPGAKDNRVLNRCLIYLKAIHEFTKKIRA